MFSLGEDVTNTTTIIADVNSEQSLQEMASKTKVLLNCCGPYRFFGEPVINACIANGTHHLDISGEPQVNYFCGDSYISHNLI